MLANNTQMYVENCSFSNNSAFQTGALKLVGKNSTLVIASSTFTNNTGVQVWLQPSDVLGLRVYRV